MELPDFQSLMLPLLAFAGDGQPHTLTEARTAVATSLGLDSLYIQAKRWAGTVGRPEIQRFVGALHGQRARKGVFITTGTFSAEARAYVQQIEPRVVLMDGDELAARMYDFDLGVVTQAQVVVKRVDTGWFGEEPPA